MKMRLLVMNGQRIIQADQGGKWSNQKVDKAGELKPGIYNLFTGKDADKSKKNDGVIIHSDDNKIYQKLDKKITMHDKKDFDIVPANGSNKSISYNDKGKALVAPLLQVGRSRSR